VHGRPQSSLRSMHSRIVPQLPRKDTGNGLGPVAIQQGMFIAYASAPARPQIAVSTAVLTLRPAAAEPAKPPLDHLVLFQNAKADVQPRSMVLDLTTPSSAREVIAAGTLCVRCYAPTTRTELRGHTRAGVRQFPLPLRRIERRRHVPGEHPLHCVWR
jgi:hypothetical protein